MMNLPKKVSRQHRLKAFLDARFDALGAWVVHRPITTIIMVLACFGAVAPGVAMLKPETQYDKLWYSQRGLATREDRFLEQRFGKPPRISVMIVEGTNLLEKLTKVLKLHERVTGKRFDDVCERAWDGGPCKATSLLNLWEQNETTLFQDPDVLLTASPEPLWDPVLSRPMDIRTVAADVVRINGKVQSAKALQLSYEVDDSVGDPRKQTLRYEHDDFLEACLDGDEDFNVYCSAADSYSDLNNQVVDANANFIVVAILIMVAYIWCYFATCDTVNSRGVLGLTIVITVGVALLFALGISGFVGMPFTILSFLSIFVILGVGIDDMIIIVDAVDRRTKLNDAPDVVRYALRDVGASILLSSLTDIVALIAGSFIDIPAIKYLCITAALAIFAVFVVQVTLFCACLVLDQHRRSAGRLELLPCFKRRSSTPATIVDLDDLIDDDGIEIIERKFVAFSSSDSTTSSLTSSSSENTDIPRETTQSNPTLTETTSFASFASFGGATVDLDREDSVDDVAVACGCLASNGWLDDDDDLKKPKKPPVIFPEETSDDEIAVLETDDVNDVEKDEIPPLEEQKKKKQKVSFRRVLEWVARNVIEPRPRLVLGFFLVAAVTFAGVTTLRLKRGTQWSLYVPRGSYLLDFYDARARTFGDMETVALVSGRVHVDRREHIEAVDDLSRRLGQLDEVVTEPVFGWFEAWMLAGGNQTTDFTVSNLVEFLETDLGRAYRDDVRFNAEKTKVTATRLRVLVEFPKNADDRLRVMRRLRRASRKASVSGGVKFRPSNQLFASLARYQAVPVTTATTMGAAIVAVLLLCSLLLTLGSTALVAVAVCLVNNSIIAGMAIFGFRLNIVGICYLVMSVGFSVDFSAHIAFACAEEFHSLCRKNSKTRRENAVTAVETALFDLGASVLHGGASTALAVTCLYFATFFAYRMMAAMFHMMVCSALAHALLFVPSAFLIIYGR